jgi:hypothetical protein
MPRDVQIVTDRDEEQTGAPYCDGHCERCNKSWGDNAISD